MKLTIKQIKKRYYDKAYKNAPVILCTCGCGRLTKSKDKYGRDKKYINGHNGRKYDDPKQYKREWTHRNRKKRYTAKQRWIRRRKKNLIIKWGGKCGLCGIEFDGECTSIFDFHHRVPSKKKFCINNRTLNRYGIKAVEAEAKKCDLICANCHRMLHWDWSA